MRRTELYNLLIRSSHMCLFCVPSISWVAANQSYEMPMQYATLSKATARPSSLYLSRSKSISNSNPDLASTPVSPDEEVQRIIGTKVSELHALCKRPFESNKKN